MKTVFATLAAVANDPAPPGIYHLEFLIRPVWRKISICEINFKLKRKYRDHLDPGFLLVFETVKTGFNGTVL